VVLDEQTLVTGVDTINLTAATGLAGANQETTLVFGDDFRRDTTITTTDDIASSVLTITNRVSAVDTNQALTLFANGGAGLTLNDLYGRSKVAITLTVNDAGGATTIASTATAATDGNVDLDIQAGTTGTISSITLVDKNQAAGVLPAGTSLDTGAITVTVDNAWSKAAFSFNASAIDNAVVTGGTAAQTETALADGGLTFDGSAELDAALTVLGTGNSDTITGGAVADNLSGNGGNDSIVGGLGADTISGGAGKDTLLGGAGADVIDGGAGDDSITGGTGADILTGGAGVDTYSYSDVTESTGASSDTITDWEAGDKISITATSTGSDVVNLGRFSASGDNTSLDQNSFDAFYGNGQLAIDVNGDGQINDNVDYAIKSAAAIAATDINYTLTLGDIGYTVRLGQGVDKVTTGTGADTFVLVGTISDAQAAAYATAGAGVVAGGNLSKVVPFGDLTTARTTSDVTKGDVINGGAGTDTLHVYGAMDLANNVTLTSIETLVVHSDITLSPEQLASIGTLKFDGDSAHTLKIVQPATTVGGVTTPAKALTPAEVISFLKGEQVAGVTTKVTTVINVELTNSGANTTVALGTSSTTSTTDIVKALPVQEFLFTSGIVTAASGLVVSLTGQSATYLNNTSNSLAAYKDGGITGDLSFSTDLALASLNTLLNSVKVDNTKTSVLGTSGNDTIDLSGVTRGLTINGGLGNDTVTSTQGKDAINVSQGDETLVLTAATTGSVTLGGATINIATIDRVTGFGTGDTLQLPFVPAAVSGSTATGTVIGVIRGTASGDTFTVAANGADYLFVYDADGAGAGETLDAVVLVGYTPTVTGATGGTGSTGTFGG
jgi:Ca2+-binding RTX toxin-like protein